MRNKTLIATALINACLLSGGAHANQLLNGKFEKPSAPKLGNNIGTAPTHWDIPGRASNLVKVDGPGGHNYGASAGPDQDGDGAATIQNPRQYLDILGAGSAVQSFTAKCNGKVKVSGAFSPRVTGGGDGAISLHEGNANGNVVATSGAITIPAKSGRTYKWTPVKFTATVQKGKKYTYVAKFDDNLNLDNASVTCPKDKGMTFGIYDPEPSDNGYQNPTTGVISVGCNEGGGGKKCDPIKGDTICSTKLPLLCFNKLGLSQPASMVVGGNWFNWSGGVVGTTKPMPAPDALSKANAACVAEFGKGWRVAEFHDGAKRNKGFRFQAFGNVGTKATRFWIDIDDQKNGVCWDRSK